MADDRDGGRVLKLPIQRLEPSGLPVDVDLSQRFGVHTSSGNVRGGASRTKTRPPSIFTSCAATPTSVEPGQFPDFTSKDHRCHGHTNSSPIRSPSPSGPPR